MVKGVDERINAYWEEKPHERRSFSLTEKGKEYHPFLNGLGRLGSFDVSIRNRNVRVTLNLDTETIAGATIYGEILELLDRYYSFKIGKMSSNKKRVCGACENIYYLTKRQPPYSCPECGHKQRK